MLINEKLSVEINIPIFQHSIIPGARQNRRIRIGCFSGKMPLPPEEVALKAKKLKPRVVEQYPG